MGDELNRFVSILDDEIIITHLPHWAARISWPVAKKMWEGDISNQRLDTGRKVARALGCQMDDLYEYVEDESEAA